MNSDRDTRCRVGCPIRRPRDHRSLASPPGFSQRATSFIASQCQGIHQMPFFACSPVSPTEETAPPPRTGSNPAFAGAGSHAPAVSHEDTSRTDPVLEQRGPVRLGHIINALFTLQSTPAPRSPAALVLCFPERPARPQMVPLGAAPLSRAAGEASPSTVVEVNGLEPMTSCLQSRRSPS
jgi:hypothetical protein